MTGKPARPRPGRLVGEDRTLWEAVTRSVRPLGSPQAPMMQTPALRPREPQEPLFAGPPPSEAKVPPGRANRRQLRRLGRDPGAIDSRLDLHGMTQQEAWRVLVRHLAAAARRGEHVVLVITGKGGARFPQLGGEPAQYRRREAFRQDSGVLRRMVPLWLAGGELAPLVAAIAPAHIRHGGEGALYVMLRRRRAPTLPGGKRGDAP